MKRWLAVVAGGFGLAAYLRRRQRRRAPVEVEPVDELRRKLAEARSEAEVTASSPEPEAAAPDELDERRRGVHDRARAAIDELA